MFEKPDLRVNYEELCYSCKVRFEEVHDYLAYLI